MAKSSTVTVRIPAALRARLNNLAEATARTRSWLAAHALEVYVDDQEWQLSAIRKGKKDFEAGRVASHQRVSNWLRSWGRNRKTPAPRCE